MSAQAPLHEGWLGIDAVRDARERTRDLVRHTACSAYPASPPAVAVAAAPERGA